MHRYVVIDAFASEPLQGNPVAVFFDCDDLSGERMQRMAREMNLSERSGSRTVYGGQFDWGGLLLKSNGGVRRCAQTGRKSVAEYKGKSALDCETDTSSRYESRS